MTDRETLIKIFQKVAREPIPPLATELMADVANELWLSNDDIYFLFDDNGNLIDICNSRG